MTAPNETPVRRSRVERHKTAYRVQSVLAWIMTILVAAGLLYTVFFLWLTPVRASGDSMAPTLQNGEVLFLDRAAKYWKTPARGDIIAFTDPATGSLLLRRIVALEGESVDVQDGLVYINGCPLSEDDYLRDTFPAADSAAITVPHGKVFVLADDRSYNGDSRDAAIGCIGYDRIRGVLRLRLLPAGRIALFY